MKYEERSTMPRRGALLGFAALASACAGAQRPVAPAVAAAAAEDDDDDPVKDLMFEHGALRRIFGVYTEAARRLGAGESFDVALVGRAAGLMRTLGEDHHERDEEDFIFPVVARDPALAPLVRVLLAQHARGREVTTEIRRLAALASPADRAPLRGLLEGFVRMYNAHATREDTVVFHALQQHASPHALHDIGEAMEQRERAAGTGDEYDATLAELTTIEQALGIADLAGYTQPA